MNKRGRQRYTNPLRFFGGLALLITLAALVLLAFIAPDIYMQPQRAGHMGWLIAVSTTTFLLYGLDKMQAKRGGVRAPKKLLHLLALLGGFTGGWLGMIVFRHKRRQGEFIYILLLATAIHLLISLWL